MNIHRRAVVAATLAFGLSPMPAMADDLRGYSLDISAIWDTTFRQGHSGPLYRHHRIYIGQAGDVFDYVDQTNTAAAEHAGTVVALEAAKTTARDRMRAWTLQGNRLTGLVKVTEGIFASTIDVDPGRTTCTISMLMQPDPNTHRVVIQRLNGQMDEIMSLTIRSYTCTVRKGNIFAADQ